MRVASWPGPSTAMGNPYVRLLIAALEDEGASVVDFSPRSVPSCDIVHVHWPEWVLDAPRRPAALARIIRLLGALARARRRGARLVWTVHNLGAHDSAGGRFGWSGFTRQVDGFISLTEAAVEPARSRFPPLADVPGFVIPHGHYRDAYPNTVSRSEARSSLDLPPSATVGLFLGQVRRYKNVPALLRTFARVGARDDGAGRDQAARDGADHRLIVAGRPANDALRQECVAAGGDDPRLQLRLDFVPPHEVQYLMAAADVVILPYRETLNSGAALLALSFDRPVLAPAAGAFVDLERRLGADWVRTYDGELDPAMLEAALQTPPPVGPAPLDDFSWPEIARLTLAAYTTLRT